MQKHFKILLPCWLFTLLAFGQTDKMILTEQVLAKAVSYQNISPVIDIIKSYPDIFKYIPSIYPIAKKNKPNITSNYGRRFHPIDKVYKFHTGIDLIAGYATTIHATADGKVKYAGFKGGYGKCVIIEHKYGFQTLYGHMTAYYTRVDAKVKKGEIIGFLGSTGKSTGNHLHYEVIKNNSTINPIDFLSL